MFLPDWPLYSLSETFFGVSSGQSYFLVVSVAEWINPAVPTANITAQMRLPPRIFDWIESEKDDVAIAGAMDKGIDTNMVDRPDRSQEL